LKSEDPLIDLKEDPNQNEVANIMFGMTEYGRMKYMLNMAEHFKFINLLEQRKKLSKSAEAYY
jgi:hypothetical protein